MKSDFPISQAWLDLILDATGASAIEYGDSIQTLWSGYGEILKLKLRGGSLDTAILKYISPPDDANHPRGWNTNLSHQRKLRSYEVETLWYQQWSDRCDDSCRVPRCLASASDDGKDMILMEDLDAAGFPVRLSSVSPQQLEACLKWLANFHATYIQEEPEGLWPIGTYWHLDTRPDELAAMEDSPLKQAAHEVDDRLNQARYKTFVHGDAKVANFCFSGAGNRVAAVDFQYVGGGCGMKDVAYFLGSCLDEDACEQGEAYYLEIYFSALRSALKTRGSTVDANALEQEWRALFPVAWTDFHRFLLGWMPGHWKINNYSHRLADEVVKALR